VPVCLDCPAVVVVGPRCNSCAGRGRRKPACVSCGGRVGRGEACRDCAARRVGALRVSERTLRERLAALSEETVQQTKARRGREGETRRGRKMWRRAG
jgi:hypothetical protein